MVSKREVFTISGVGGVLAIIAAAYSLWPSFGWMTPNSHAADIDQAVGDIRAFRDEWKCDEWDEELLDLQKELAAATEARRIEIQHEIDKLKQKMLKTDCSRFEDFG